MTADRAHAPTLSRLMFSDLALRSAVELERGFRGSDYQTDPIGDLADVLERAAQPANHGAPFKFVEPGYYQTFESLYQSKKSDPVQSIEQIQEFMSQAVERLRAIEAHVEGSQIDKELISFCITLHRELIRGLAAEGNSVVHERRHPGLPTSSGIR